MLLWKVCILINWYELRSNVLCGLLKWFSLKKGINDFFFFWQLFNIIGFLGPVNKRTDNVIQGINRYPKYKKYTPTQTLAKVLVHSFYVGVFRMCIFTVTRANTELCAQNGNVSKWLTNWKKVICTLNNWGLVTQIIFHSNLGRTSSPGHKNIYSFKSHCVIMPKVCRDSEKHVPLFLQDLKKILAGRWYPCLVWQDLLFQLPYLNNTARMQVDR